MNLYFPNVGRRCELVEAFKKALVKFSPGFIWGSDIDPLAPALNVVDKIINLPAKVGSPSYIDALVNFLNDNHIDLVIPTIDPDLERLNSWRAELKARAPRSKLLLSSQDVIACSAHKIRSREMFATLGAEVPEGVDLLAEDQLPLFVKPARGSASIGAKAVYTMPELHQAMADVDEPVVERIVSGDEITIDVLLTLDGEPVIAVPRRRLKVRAGEVVQSLLERNEELESLSLKLATGFGCIGPVTVQFRNPAPNKWVAMEINARMGGGLPLSIAAGADWPTAILEMAAGIDRQHLSIQHPKNDVMMSRYDSSFFIHKKTPKTEVEEHIGILPPLVILDMDDTLYPEIDFVFGGYREAAKVIWEDYAIEAETILKQKFLEGLRGDLFSHVLLNAGVEFEESYIVNRLVQAYRNHDPFLQPFVDVIPFLKQLKKSGRKIALISDGIQDVQQRKFKSLNLSSYFDYVLFSDSLGRENWKPSPSPFQDVCTKLGFSPSEGVYIGDNPDKDFTGPNMLGMGSIRIRRKGGEHANKEPNSLENTALHEISSLSDLIGKL